MTATISFVGTRLTDAESVTNWGINKFTGGGGTWASPVLNNEAQRQGSNCVQWTSANAAEKAHFCWFNHTAENGTNLDFSAGGANEGEFLYIWGQMLLPLPTTGNRTTLPGLAVGLASNGSAAANTAWWAFYGVENYPGGWQRLVLDPRKVPTASGASFNLSDIDYIGLVVTTTAGRAVPACLIDAIDVGSGLRYEGSGVSDGFDEILTADLGTATNSWGVLEALEGTDTVIGVRGNLFIGESGSSTFFESQDKVIAFEAPQYQDATAQVNSCQDDAFALYIEEKPASSGGTDVQFGLSVGAGDDLNGRNGITFLGNSLYDYNIIIESGVDSVRTYGSVVRGFNNDLNWSGNANFEIAGTQFDNNGQFTPDKDTVIRNSTFLNASGQDKSSLYWTSGINIKNCSFINNANINSSGSAIEHPESITAIYDGLTFSANDFDIYFSQATSGDLTINATNSSNPTTVRREVANSTVTIVNTVTLTLEGIVANSNPNLSSEVRIFTAGTTTELDGVENVTPTGNGLGKFEFAFEGGDPNVDIRIFNLNYRPVDFLDFSLPASNAAIPIQQIFDRNYENP